MKKSEIPLEVLNIVEPYVIVENDYFELDRNDTEFAIMLRDKDQSTGFFFAITLLKVTDKGLIVSIKYKPQNTINVGIHQADVSASQLANRIDDWINLIKGYKTNKVFEDPILNSFSHEFFTEFQILDEDANIKPFATNQILYLDQHLDFLNDGIDEFKNAENEKDIEVIKSEINELRVNLTKKSKNGIMKSLSKVWARIAKQGIQPMKKLLGKFVVDALKDGLKEGVKYIITNPIEAIEKAKDILG